MPRRASRVGAVREDRKDTHPAVQAYVINASAVPALDG